MLNILLTSLLFHPKADVCNLITPAQIQSVSTLSARESLNSSSSPSFWRGLETPGASCRLMPLRNVSSASAAWLHVSREGKPQVAGFPKMAGFPHCAVVHAAICWPFLLLQLRELRSPRSELPAAYFFRVVSSFTQLLWCARIAPHQSQSHYNWFPVAVMAAGSDPL